MNVYAHLSYQAAIEEILKERRSEGSNLTLRALADATGLQPSFLTNVLKRRFEFSADQLYAVADYLKLSPSEREYLLLLLEHQRSSHRPRKVALKSQIDERRKQNQKSEKHIDVKTVTLSQEAQSEYYLDPFVQVVLFHLRMSPYDREPTKLCAKLGIAKPQLEKILEVLGRLGYTVREAGRYKVVYDSQHLPQDAPLCGPHQALLRMRSIDQLQRLSPDEKYSFSVTFTGTDETRIQLQEAFFAFLKRAEAIVKPAPAERSFQMNFDLFPWALE